MDKNNLWQTKIHARLHDPAEKALVLLRDPEGHEGGTCRALHRDLGFQDLSDDEKLPADEGSMLSAVLSKGGIPLGMYRKVKQADWWAAAADRPQWPMQEVLVTTRKGEQKTLKIANWAQVRWHKSPVLIHPLTGKTVDLKSLAETDVEAIKDKSLDHFLDLIVHKDQQVDWHKTLLALWRFGPELSEEKDNGSLGLLWPLLPADTRVPDHSIWDHLDLTSAFAGAFAADAKGEASLLAMSLGPVQPFIAAARSTSDLWAGSHLLSRLAWEAMRVVCEVLGPDAILFPRLRGIPQVDMWLREQMEMPAEWFASCAWTHSNTDANPLFAAALPNRFVAVVPADAVQTITQQIKASVRVWLQQQGESVIRRLLEAAQLNGEKEVYAYTQLQEQLQEFPEVHWAAVPFSLVQPRDKARQTDLDTSELSASMAPFFGVDSSDPSGFLCSKAWQVLQKSAQATWQDNSVFFAPNPGVLYPAVYELAERVLAAAKATRPFAQSEQHGWRDSLTGEHEWLSLDRQALSLPPGERTNTLWAKVAARKPAWARKGEHLGALSAIKRLWPTLFAEEVAQATGQDKRAASRFVVSTHTMALVWQIDQWLGQGGDLNKAAASALESYHADAVAMPRKLLNKYREHHGLALAKRLPGLLDLADEMEVSSDERSLADVLRKQVKDTLAEGKTEAYYALLLLDGDHMGRILSGDPTYAISYLQSFHPQVKSGFEKQAAANADIQAYAAQARALSPNRHLAVSAALNDFALHVVPEVVEAEHFGRVIYAGGDDVMAMLPVADLFSCMQRLRNAYSGNAATGDSADWQESVKAARQGLVCKAGFALLRGQLYRMMGEQATASCGAVIAHHQAPLNAVLRELRAAERRAKTEGGRNAFSLTLIKRSGGSTHFTAKWGEPLQQLIACRDFLADGAVSRRAAYNTLMWLKDLPGNADTYMLGSMLAYQFQRQTGNKAAADHLNVHGLAQGIAQLAVAEPESLAWIERFLVVAEFLARETRTPQQTASKGDDAA